MLQRRYPSLYQVNTRVYLSELAVEMDRPATLDDIPDRELEKWVEAGFDLIWFLAMSMVVATGGSATNKENLVGLSPGIVDESQCWRKMTTSKNKAHMYILTERGTRWVTREAISGANG